jgi:hypothetical protein
MPDALSAWHAEYNASTHGTDYTTFASDLGMKPGEQPGSRSLPGGRFALAFQWVTQREEGELIYWAIKIGLDTFTIYND